MAGKTIIQSCLKEEDIRSFAKHQVLSGYIIKLFGMIIIINLIIAVYRYYFYSEMGPIIFGILFIFIMGLVVALAIPSVAHILVNKYRETCLMDDETTYEFDEEGMMAKTAFTSSFTLWSEVHKVVESSACFFIYLAPGKIIIIPKRYFNKTQLEDVSVLIESKVKKQQFKKNASSNKVRPLENESKVPRYGIAKSDGKPVNIFTETSGNGSDQVDDVLCFSVNISKKDYVEMNLRMSYHEPLTYIMMVIGIFLIIFFLYNMNEIICNYW